MGSRIKSGSNGEVIAVAVATDEYITKATYVMNDTATSVFPTALLKVKANAAMSGDIKVTLAGKEKTVMIVHSDDVNEANVHVVKVWLTGTDLVTTDFYLWQ